MTRLTEEIDAALGAEVAPDAPGAAVAVLRDGEFLHCKGYGLADVEWGIPIAPDTVFHIASLTKQFTATAIMMLKERGLVSLDAPLETYLPDFPTRGRRVTLRHLLNHTSGIQTYSSLAYHTNGAARLHASLKDLVARIAGLPFDFEPGERYLYNNSGYVLLGAIIERVGGMKYREFLEREIFRPLGMSRTLYLFDEPVVPRRAAGYQRGGAGIENASYVSATSYHAAGGLGSTVLDLARWDKAVRTNLLVSAKSQAEMLRPTVLSDGSEFPYGYGWGTATYRGRRIYHHAGGISGFACHMLHCRDEDVSTIVLSNLYQFAFDRVARGLVRAVLGEAPVVQPRKSLTAGALAACAGSFRAEGTPDTAERRLVPTGEGLAFAEPGGPQLMPIADGHFCESNDGEVEYVFNALENGSYARFRYASPLFPPTTYRRCEPAAG
ncbi:MAG TPA: serine hydrolase domain-containing protein [Rhizomicrobium sp.]